MTCHLSVYPLSSPRRFNLPGSNFQGVMLVTVGCLCGLGEDHIKTLSIGLKKANNGILARKTHGATGLKLCMHTQLYSGSNMGWVPLGHASSSWCVRLKCQKSVSP